MSDQARVAKVLAALLVSMTIGTVVLMATSGNPPSAGPFSLANYCMLSSIDSVLTSQTTQRPDRWNSIEIYYSRTKAGNIEQLSSLSGLSDTAKLDCHFVVCNGLGGHDGQIQTTERWNKQWSVIAPADELCTPKTIRICVIADGTEILPTNLQIRRTELLVEKLSLRFEIEPQNVYYPQNWR